jgi:hypothetical protein
MDVLSDLGGFFVGVGLLLGGVSALWWVAMQPDNGNSDSDTQTERSNR